MQKEMYLVRGSANESYQGFTERILSLAHEACNLKPAALKLTITTRKPPSFSVMPFKKDKLAVISVYNEDPMPVESFLKSKGFSGGWRVEEAIPVAYQKDWPDGERTPGINLLTLFNKKKGLSYEEFLDRWHNGHTPLSLKVHPLWNYNRNVVKDAVAAYARSYDGIVEEHFRSEADLLNPFKFFGNPLIILGRMWQVYSDTNGFLDYKNIETYLADEIHIQSAPQ